MTAPINYVERVVGALEQRLDDCAVARETER